MNEEMNEMKTEPVPAEPPRQPVEKTKKPKKAKPPTRGERWVTAASEALAALEQAQTALEELQAIQDEFEDWRDNLPENLAGSALGEKLEAVCELDVDGGVDAIQTVLETVSDAEGADLPLGFGRD